MDTLFEFISEEASAELFKKLLEQFKRVNEFVEEYQTKYMRDFFNVHKQEIIKDKLRKIQEFIVQTEQYITNGDIDMAVKIQMENILPLSKFIQTMKYEQTEIVIANDKNDATYILQQRPIILDKMIINLGERVSVEHK